MPKHPFQPLVTDPSGTVRFKPNKIIERLVNDGTIDLNKVAIMTEFDADEHQHFNQLHGYSVSGWGDLNCVSRDTCAVADRMTELHLQGIPYDEKQVRIDYLESKMKEIREITIQAMIGLNRSLNIEVEDI